DLLVLDDDGQASPGLLRMSSVKHSATAERDACRARSLKEASACSHSVSSPRIYLARSGAAGGSLTRLVALVAVCLSGDCVRPACAGGSRAIVAGHHAGCRRGLSVLSNQSKKPKEISMMAFPRQSLVPAALVSAATICFTLPATSQTVENFYKSHELTILIGHPPGGSYDLYAQLAAAHIGKYIPGKPTVIVQS